ncbi:MAG: formylglycine-generating enzyme family protein [Myxococcales bacterium]|nr:formylglycine-generating enzyme family protein [Myxococcales bacterium]
MCAERQRICLSDCSWTDYEMTADPGECEPGTTRMVSEGCAPGDVREETCSDTCGWVESMACSDPCGGTARTSPEWKSEVCIPAGPFMRGSTDFLDTQPVAEVYVSAYYIDRYPVTNRRYQECVVAGACNLMYAGSIGGRSYADPSRADYPVQSVYQADIRAFCAWDGGRRLPTEAEWEKAVRGPSPRTNPFPWDGTAYRCDLVNNQIPPCTYRRPAGESSSWAVDPYDGLPGSISYYGTYLQYGGVPELVTDYYSATYYSDPTSLTDPTGPATGTTTVRRGDTRQIVHLDLALRQETTLTDGSTAATGFRCARSAP